MTDIDPIRKKSLLNQYKITSLNESILREIIREEINEVLGAFDRQYELSILCAKAVKELVNSMSKEEINMIRSGYFHPEYHEVKLNSKDVRGAKIQLSQIDVNGQTIGITPDKKYVIIEIGINAALRKTEEELTDIFSHELMHGNVFLKRYDKNKETYDTTPDYYGNLKFVFSNYSGTLAYNFAHALYACFYQETNALVSQVYTNIMMEVGNRIISENEFMDIYTNTNSYMEFNVILTETVPLINKMDDLAIEKWIIRPFKNCGMNFNVRGVRKECKRIEKIANEAIKKCGRNASLCYSELKKNGQIK